MTLISMPHPSSAKLSFSLFTNTITPHRDGGNTPPLHLPAFSFTPFTWLFYLTESFPLCCFMLYTNWCFNWGTQKEKERQRGTKLIQPQTNLKGNYLVSSLVIVTTSPFFFSFLFFKGSLWKLDTVISPWDFPWIAWLLVFTCSDVIRSHPARPCFLRRLEIQSHDEWSGGQSKDLRVESRREEMHVYISASTLFCVYFYLLSRNSCVCVCV